MKRSLILGVLILSLLASAKDKKKVLLPDLVLQARTVMVVVDPDSGLSLTDPGENTTARSDVTSALEKWGRFSPTLDKNFADLIIVLHRGGRALKPTIGGVPNEAPGTIWSRDQDVNVRIGGAPPLGSDDQGRMGGPTGQTEISNGEDVFAVYLGKTENPLDASPIWRYSAHDGLQHPSVPAVDKFHKAIEQAEKAKK